MIIVWGTKLYGRVDQVEKEMHIATQFFHVQFIPLIPLRSFIVSNYTDSQGEFERIPIAMSLKSVFAAYLRTGLIIGSLYFLFNAISNLHSNQSLATLQLMSGSFLALSIWISYQLMRANEKRAKELLQERRNPSY